MRSAPWFQFGVRACFRQEKPDTGRYRRKGNGGTVIHRTDEDQRRFLGRLAELAERFCAGLKRTRIGGRSPFA